MCERMFVVSLSLCVCACVCVCVSHQGHLCLCVKALCVTLPARPSLKCVCMTLCISVYTDFDGMVWGLNEFVSACVNGWGGYS